MDVRLKSNVIFNGAVQPIGAVLSLTDKEGGEWIERGLAEKVESAKSEVAKETKTVKTSTKKSAKK